jgi:hypothetical protein
MKVKELCSNKQGNSLCIIIKDDILIGEIHSLVIRKIAGLYKKEKKSFLYTLHNFMLEIKTT